MEIKERIKRFFIKNPFKPGGFTGEVIQTRSLSQSCMVCLVKFKDVDGDNKIPVLLYADGSQFTPSNWKDEFNIIPQNLNDINWIPQFEEKMSTHDAN